MDLSDKVMGSEEVITGLAMEIATPEVISSEIQLKAPEVISSEIQVKTPEVISSEIQVKNCVDCGATKTPLWRSGPAGPKSLCNACGIRSRKKKRDLLGLNKDDKKKKSSANSASSSGDSTSGGSSSSNVEKKKKKKKSPEKKPDSISIHWSKLDEVERAAFLLMSLTCGSVRA
ncbi:hypothetical protein RDI58_001502 [Solanum bulbocastanum]|uniref:GATA-type domain-containing protein n=1 Tax=Solanum bulbocastanum TaxID=147425 RepID=A0AAN8U9P1_SOLBU